MTAAIAAAVVGVGGSIYASNKAGDAASAAAGSQVGATKAGIAEQRRQFDLLQKNLAPYMETGADALAQQAALLGLGGADAQQQAYNALAASPAFTSLLSQGENALLQNASATGGLRGGNTQAALGQLAPGLLNQLVSSQLGSLGGLASMGQSSAAGVGSAGMQTGANISNLLQQQGAAIAGGQLAQGAKYGNIASAISGGLGTLAGLGTFGGSGLGSGTGGLGVNTSTLSNGLQTPQVTYQGSGTYNFGNLGTP